MGGSLTCNMIAYKICKVMFKTRTLTYILINSQSNKK